MKALVIVESIWGNTEQLAREVAVGLGGGHTEVVDAASAPAGIEADVDLVVVAGPTHAFSMSTAATREAARKQGAERIPDRGIREWIEAQPSPGRAIPVATFDTRVVSPRLPGSAARKAMKRLVALGFRPVAHPETFGVHGYSGPLADGEAERARQWGEELARLLPVQ
ncbi:flavodoxin family protein [Mycetocola miduiensis]|uniref:Flavodoxin n=1 Tax=Mycetocola miduiensis TaxID=995034 RepID=A0A1I4YNQ3_9MICO|nr:flavodoxin family protein [Mycetocola miduiensis]SFN39654.1 Flavodoxin [Mycetocola miduiensis]